MLTRQHSSRMRTARLLTLRGEGVVGVRGRGMSLEGGTTPTSCGQTDTCENITFPKLLCCAKYFYLFISQLKLIFDVTMATGGGGSTPRLYEEDDRLDEKLLNDISKWIMYNRLPSLARHLGLSVADISRIINPFNTPEEQCFQVWIFHFNTS